MQKHKIENPNSADVVFYVYNDKVFDNTKKIESYRAIIYDRNGIKVYKNF